MYYKLLEKVEKNNGTDIRDGIDQSLDFISYDDYNLNSINDIPDNLLQIPQLQHYMWKEHKKEIYVYTYLQQDGEENPQILGYEIKI